MQYPFDCITELVFVETELEKSDVIFIPGGSHPQLVEIAARLYHQGLAQYILPSGGYNLKLTSYKSEWAFLKATAVQYNVEDISNNLKRGGSFIPGVRPGKQTKDFLDDVISRITIVGACFLALIALLQFLASDITGIQRVGYFFGTSLLIMVSVALETMRQIEANLLMKQYGGA